MKDRFTREIDYLRLSITERCTLKCAYCRANEGLCPKTRELDANSLIRIVRAGAKLGITKVRLTGGEPMLRRDLDDLISACSNTDGIREVVMTTNAQALPGRAASLARAGLSRINISCDSLDEERYRSLTGGGELQNVLRGMDEAVMAGLYVKLNVVLMRGVNDLEADAFIELTRDMPIDVRFIELMPMGEVDRSESRVTTDELLLSHDKLVKLPSRYDAQPSEDYAIQGYAGRVGFISPISHRFCAKCDRVRVMSDGMLRPCLGANGEVSLLEALNEGDDALVETMWRAIYNKPETHSFGCGFETERSMSRIGG